MSETITASELVRNDRVVLNPADLPHLVDSVDEHGPHVRVVFSSGETRLFWFDQNVTIVG